VSISIRSRYGDPNRIVISVEGSGANDFGIDDALGERCHDVVAATSHGLSSCAVFCPCVCPVVFLLEDQDGVAELVLRHEGSNVDIAGGSWVGQVSVEVAEDDGKEVRVFGSDLGNVAEVLSRVVAG